MEIMKKILFGLFMVALIISCVNNTKKADNGYRKKIETIRKHNNFGYQFSKTRVFYVVGNEDGDTLKASKEIGENEYTISLNKSGKIILYKEDFDSFIENYRISIENKDENKPYYISGNYRSPLSFFVTVDNGIKLYFEGVFTPTDFSSYELSNDDVINLKKAFDKFNSEK
jgi:hypothetical protein